MNFKLKAAAAAVCAIGLGSIQIANATEIIKFAPTGSGPGIDVGAFDWAVNNALIQMGNPAGGLTVGAKVTVLAHARMAVLLGPMGETIALPSTPELTFVAKFGEVVTAVTGGTNANFAFDPAAPTYFEIWAGSPPDSNPLSGTGYNDGKRILFGSITNASGGFASSATIQAFDQSPDGNQYPGISTVTGSGSTQISVQIISVDPDYFPGFGPTQVADIKAFFNTSTVVPFRQTNPSALFTDGDALGSFPVTNVVPNIGTVNGQLGNVNRDFQIQADANQSFEPGEVVAGACRVTYGGNDRNGNIDLAKFGESCSPDGRRDENCYTFGGQVGAPTANPALGGPFGEHTHHQKSGPAGDFVFHAGTRSSLKTTRIDATICKDPGACRQAVANAGFKQIDFEGTGSFRTLNDTARAYLMANGAVDPRPDNQSSQIYYFRVDMDDLGEPGNQWSPKKGPTANACRSFFTADQNAPLATPDPLFHDYVASCSSCPDVYQFYICKDENKCEPDQAMYHVRGFLTGGNIQIHKVIK